MPIDFLSTMPAYAVGRRANMEEWNAFTCTAAAAVAFGVPVMPGTGEGNTCVELDAQNGRNVLGITEASQVLPHPGDNYEQYDNVAVCEFGVIGVMLGANVTRGAQARYNTQTKTWTAGAQSANIVTIPGAQFDADGANGSVGVVRYRRPVPSLSVSGA